MCISCAYVAILTLLHATSNVFVEHLFWCPTKFEATVLGCGRTICKSFKRCSTSLCFV